MESRGARKGRREDNSDDNDPGERVVEEDEGYIQVPRVMVSITRTSRERPNYIFLSCQPPSSSARPSPFPLFRLPRGLPSRPSFKTPRAGRGCCHIYKSTHPPATPRRAPRAIRVCLSLTLLPSSLSQSSVGNSIVCTLDNRA